VGEIKGWDRVFLTQLKKAGVAQDSQPKISLAILTTKDALTPSGSD
jgi:hypothetical protein